MKKRYAALIFCAIGLLLGSVTSEAKKKPSVTAESAIVMDFCFFSAAVSRCLVAPVSLL